ncbi:MAG: tail fiber domain-containing protein [Nitrospirae bacterium]|nr:tail fiber domain-containing protein [Nitrospirota bacterium]MBF0535934.1 tail fiber domain-containing protein [Nitrospirota bacterium]MBF0617734.1 tail fiber domain-containing protein [Nitrospirota bacterium]
MKSFIGKKSFKYGALVVLLVLVLAVVAYAATVPYTFTSGTTAKSSEVNSNFTYLANRSWELSSSNLYYDNGNVGIGTSGSAGFDGSAHLEIKKAHPKIALNSTDTSNYGIILFAENGVDGGGLTRENTGMSDAAGMMVLYSDGRNIDNNKMGIRFDIARSGLGCTSDWCNAMIINKDLHVGIGTTSPTYPLHMGSGAYVTTGGVWTNASSRAYKEHIKELSSEKALEAFEQLKPVTFNYKTDKSDKHIGFIAEDVPEIVATKDRKGLSSMDVVALLTKVVQEQQKTIASLSKEVKELKDKVEAEQ